MVPIVPVNYLPLAIHLIAKNQSTFGVDVGINPIRGNGFLDLRGTSGGAATRVERYLAHRAQNGGTFPYWVLGANLKVNLATGQPVMAAAGPNNNFGPQLPRGSVPFVVMQDGTCRIGPSLRIGMPVTTNHCYISQMALQVAFAGEMRFGGVLGDEGGMRPAGVLVSWSNESGGYRCSGHDASRVGLPMNLYSGTASAPAKDRVDYLANGRGGKIDWGRHGPPAIIRMRERHYWYR